MSTKHFEVGGRTVEIGHADKVLFPDIDLTKAELADYYSRIADDMIPHIKGRPVTMQRFPDGISESGFYEKRAPEHFPEWIRRVTVRVEERGESQSQVVCDNTATLLYLVDQACITPHVWLSRAEALRKPDRMIFDLDPPSDEFEPVRFAARALRDVLETVGLSPFVMTTGSQGAHVVVPLDGSASFDTVREFAKDVADVLAERHPERLTTAVRKKKRKGRVFLDYLRNSYGQNSVAPYAVRALPGAPVATPLDWDELGGDLHAKTYSVKNLFRRMGQKDDPWVDLQKEAQSLKRARESLNELEVAP